MKSFPKFSIIICLYIITDRFFEDLEKFKNLTLKDYELIFVTEKGTNLSQRQLPLPYRQVAAKSTVITLGEKRDLGFRAARGQYCAYIDDDAYPHADWLNQAEKIFQSNNKIGAVGGPNVTALEDTFWLKVGGYTYESYFTSGKAQFRFMPKHRQSVLELQGVNMIILRSILTRLGGFHSKLSSGDDSKICSDIRTLGYDIVYDPKVLVYHHRRAFPVGHLRQIRNMGRHRGFFVKAYPKTLTPIYFVPAILAISFIVGLIGSFMDKWFATIFLSGLLLVYLVSALSVIKRAGPAISLVVGIGILATHIVYGLSFLHGLLLTRIERSS